MDRQLKQLEGRIRDFAGTRDPELERELFGLVEQVRMMTPQARSAFGLIIKVRQMRSVLTRCLEHLEAHGCTADEGLRASVREMIADGTSEATVSVR